MFPSLWEIGLIVLAAVLATRENLECYDNIVVLGKYFFLKLPCCHNNSFFEMPTVLLLFVDRPCFEHGNHANSFNYLAE